MKNQLNRDLIEELNESNNPEFLDNVNDKIYDLISCTISDISLKSPFIKTDKCVLLPVNELYTGAVSQLSEFTYFLGVENPQIEFNSKKRSNFWKNLWREFRASWRPGKKKYKKQKNTLSTDPVDKYNLNDFKHDIVKVMADYLSQTSVIYEYTSHLSIVGIDDFGTNVRINIIVCCYDSRKNLYKIYNQRKNKYFVVDFGNRFSNISYKTKTCGLIYIDMIKLINILYSKNYNKIPNQILVESLLFNCPNILFDNNDVYKTFVNVANYIRLANPQSFLSICDGSKTIFQDELITKNNSHLDYSKIIGMLDNFKY